MSGLRIEGRKLVHSRKNCNSTQRQPAAFPTAQSIRADAVLADKVQTCQTLAEELLPADNSLSRAQLLQATVAAAISYLRAAS
jgi:hypothetical protein